MWIKICGLTTPDAVEAAVNAGANAVGFVFAPSKRQVNATQARALTTNVPNHVARVAVMLHPDQASVDEVLSVFKPDVLQTDIDDFEYLQLPQSLQRLPVVRNGKMASTLPERMLFEGSISGTGEVADWAQAAEIAKRTQVVLAGGLNPQNVSEAINRVRPFGVDVSSGIESAPGVKDVAKIVAFVRAARLTEYK
jgi:phosphoribosylanthranilate isomerase